MIFQAGRRTAKKWGKMHISFWKFVQIVFAIIYITNKLYFFSSFLRIKAFVSWLVTKVPKPRNCHFIFYLIPEALFLGNLNALGLFGR